MVEEPRSTAVCVAPLTPLVSPEWLRDRLHDEPLRIVDCRFYLAEPDRGQQEYLAGHIPGSRYLSLDDDLTGAAGPGRHPLPDAAEFATAMGRIGIGSEHTVVVYDDQSAGIAARLWWMLRSLGHDRVHVLDGGWQAWIREQLPVTRSIPQWPPAELAGAAIWTGVISAPEIKDTAEELLLLDARAPERYRGETEPIDPVAGHIPGAVNIPYLGNVDAAGRFLDREELQQRFAVASGARAVVSYCGSGVTACSNLLALAVAGYPNALLYPGSWSDWCGRDWPEEQK